VFVSWHLGSLNYEGMVTTNLIMGNKFLQWKKAIKIKGKKVRSTGVKPWKSRWIRLFVMLNKRWAPLLPSRFDRTAPGRLLAVPVLGLRDVV
jgi:hypothetical protein